MKEAKLKDVIESFNKLYIRNNFYPIQIYKTNDRTTLQEKEEYICIECYFNKYFNSPTGLILRIRKKNDINEKSLVNSKNIIDCVNRYIFNDFYEMEIMEGEYNNEKRLEILEEYKKLPVFYTFDDKKYETIWATKNRYYTDYKNPYQCMRFYFCINDCNHCKYWINNECVNVISDEYGSNTKKKECNDFKNKK